MPNIMWYKTRRLFVEKVILSALVLLVGLAQAHAQGSAGANSTDN